MFVKYVKYVSTLLQIKIANKFCELKILDKLYIPNLYFGTKIELQLSTSVSVHRYNNHTLRIFVIFSIILAIIHYVDAIVAVKNKMY